MKIYVGVTDDDWFEYLAHTRPDEVNFWRPKSQTQFRALSPGELLVFKLHAPRNFIAGGGIFVRHTFLPIELAWHAFRDKNGAPDLKTFRDRILQHRQPPGNGSTTRLHHFGSTFFLAKRAMDSYPRELGQEHRSRPWV
jgi:putative restriction endonuclease